MPLLPSSLHRLAIRPTVWWLLLAVWWVTLWFLSGNPSPPDLPSFLNWDKLKHTVYFMLGGSFWTLALLLQRPHLAFWKIALTGAVVMSLIGLLDEWHQMFTPGRSGNDWGDWLADTLGGLLGPWIGIALHRFALKSPRVSANTA